MPAILRFASGEIHQLLRSQTACETDGILRPTLMGSNTGPDIADAGWQVRVIETILSNTYQIFDDD